MHFKKIIIKLKCVIVKIAIGYKEDKMNKDILFEWWKSNAGIYKKICKSKDKLETLPKYLQKRMNAIFKKNA